MGITTDCDGVIRNGDYRLEFGKWVIDHDPDDHLDYSQDIAAWLAKSGNDTIANVEIDADPRITVENTSFSATTMTAWLTGGAGAEDLLRVTYRMTTSHTPPRVKDWSIYLRIIEG